MDAEKKMGRYLERIGIFALTLSALPAVAATHFVVVGGLGGEPDYAERFAQEAEDLAETATGTVGAEQVALLKGAGATKAALEKSLTSLVGAAKADDAVVVYLIGHGSFDGKDYKFNIPGPDITAARLAQLLDNVPAKRQLVVNMTSCSGAMLESSLQKDGRIIITATKNGRERNATVFSRYWTTAFEDAEADIDKDESITVKEAYDYAVGKVDTFYKSAQRLSTEHARMEGLGPETFLLARLGKNAALALDPKLAPLFKKREELRMSIDALKLRRDGMDENSYFDELQAILLELATVDIQIENAQGNPAEGTTPQQ
jgi:hypothetical protein